MQEPYYLLNCPVSDEQWRLVSHLLQPQGCRGWGRTARDPRVILDAILWVTVNNERCHRLPAEFGPQQTAYIKWLQWRRRGPMDQVNETLSDARAEMMSRCRTAVP